MKGSHMKTVQLIACSLWLASVAIAQQVDLRMELSHNVYIVGEPIVIKLTLANNSRSPMVLEPESADKVEIEITRETDQQELEVRNSAPFFPAMKLTSGQTFQQNVEIDKWFTLCDTGKYLIRAVGIKGGMRFETRKKAFDIVPGIPLKEGLQMFVDKQHLQRKFQLVYWMREQANRLFLRIEDSPTGQAWDTIDLGLLSKVTEPKLDISPNGVIHRSTQDSFIRTVIWSLPTAIEIAERNVLVDPEVSSTERVRSLYEEMEKEEKKEKKPWWQFW
jgi:hypothetical protein